MIKSILPVMNKSPRRLVCIAQAPPHVYLLHDDCQMGLIRKNDLVFEIEGRCFRTLGRRRLRNRGRQGGGCKENERKALCRSHRLPRRVHCGAAAMSRRTITGALFSSPDRIGQAEERRSPAMNRERSQDARARASPDTLRILV